MSLSTARLHSLEGNQGCVWSPSLRHADIPGCPRDERVYRIANVEDPRDDAKEERQ